MRPDGAPGGAPADDVVEVLHENWNTVAVYRRCAWEGGGFDGKDRAIAAREIFAACVLLRIPRAEWPRISDGICLVMVPAIQKLQKQESKKGNG